MYRHRSSRTIKNIDFNTIEAVIFSALSSERLTRFERWTLADSDRLEFIG